MHNKRFYCTSKWPTRNSLIVSARSGAPRRSTLSLVCLHSYSYFRLSLTIIRSDDTMCMHAAVQPGAAVLGLSARLWHAPECSPRHCLAVANWDKLVSGTKYVDARFLLSFDFEADVRLRHSIMTLLRSIRPCKLRS